MCEVLPPIDESSPSPDGENSKLEQLMISMLEERDRLMEKLREMQEAYGEATRKLNIVETDNNVIMRQLQALMPEEEERLHQLLEEIRTSGGLSPGTPEENKRWPVAKKFAQLARDLAAAKEKVSEREEEVAELKSERNNTRLLLEHLECLVARHERSLRMTVVKRQTTNAGVSSEVEVLKALKSLFDHHKALDEKVRERLRSAQERNLILEDELMLANQEIKSLQDDNKRMKRQIQHKQRNSVRLSVCYDNISFTKEQLALLEDRDQTIDDLQFSLDETTAQFEEAIHLRDELAEKVQEVEEELAMAVKELQSQQQTIKVANKRMNEMMSVRSHLEGKLGELQTHLGKTSEELRQMRDVNQQLNDQLSTQEAKLVQIEEEAASVQADLKQRELALQKAEAISEEQKARQSEQLTQAEERQDSAQTMIEELQANIETKNQELLAAQEKESVNEGHIGRLQLTIERMLKESNERMKTHYSERKTLSDERSLYQEKAESLEKELQTSHIEKEKLVQQLEQLKNQGKGNSSAKSSKSGGVRYSWQVTDLDDAIARHNMVERTDSSTPTNEVPQSSVEGGWDLGEPEAVSRLVSMLEGQVSKLDKQLESMGDDMAEASEFDRVLQSMTEGEFHSAALETLPLSSPPGSHPKGKNTYRPESLPSSMYRVAVATNSPEASPANSSSGSNDSFSNSNKVKAQLRSKGSFSKLFRRKEKGSNHKKNQARRASAPAPTSPRQSSDMTAVMRESVDFSDFLKSALDHEDDKERKSELLTEALRQGTPFALWDCSMVVAWLEVWVGVPYWYIAAIRTSVHSGAVLANLTDAELEQELGITNTLHRLKLKLAVQEIVSLTSSSNPQLARTTSLYGEMAHEWIGDYWLPSLGLPQYSEVFKVCLIDARMLEHLTKKELRTMLKMVDSSHRNSLQYGISVLKKLDYNKNRLDHRRGVVNVENHKDVLVWTNDHMIQWVDSIGLGEYSSLLRESGVHGGVVAIDHDFDHEKLALALQIPLTCSELRKQLKVEFNTLLIEGTDRANSESLSHGRIVRKLSRRLKVGGRKVTHSSEYSPVRPSSPVLYSSKAPHLRHGFLEDEESPHNSSSNSLDVFDPILETPTELAI